MRRALSIAIKVTSSRSPESRLFLLTNRGLAPNCNRDLAGARRLPQHALRFFPNQPKTATTCPQTLRPLKKR
ncbi:hypothetical protein MPL1032_60045 [Mesorhizobium plurifarium]|uniref:Uncharacterized protein n=1 Tax=Mesorhizobium plurifarium TaxID=69974 RepID=A0A0K2W6J1_MESPL|nr:hypothetical protein MPL1032_60045 [Mesorhizobium plurifarium]